MQNLHWIRVIGYKLSVISKFMKKTISKRLRITPTGKVLHRAMGLGHNRSRKSSTQLRRKANMRILGGAAALIKQNM